MPYKATNNDEGGLWEIGVLFPIKNPTMERFEQFFSLSYDRVVGQNHIYIEELSDRVKVGATIRIGPSTDPSTSSDGATLLYYGKVEIFRIEKIERNTWYTPDLSPSNRIFLKPFDSNHPNILQNSYLKDDPINVRIIAEDWNFIKTDDFTTNIKPLDDPERDIYYNYLRGDPLNEFKGYSQEISAMENMDENDVGIIQKMSSSQRSFFNRIGGKTLRISTIIRASFMGKTVSISDDIDENVDGQVIGDDIDEGFGFTDNTGWDNIDERDTTQIGLQNTLAPYIRASFYDNVDELIPISDHITTMGNLDSLIQNTLLYDIITVSKNTLSSRFAVYGRFTSSPETINMQLKIDNAIMEHCINTSKENEGFLTVEINPKIGISISNRNKKQMFTNANGNGYNKATSDPALRYKISTLWSNISENFITDLYALEEWNKEGYPLVLRMKMPQTYPDVILCNIKITSVDYIDNYPGGRRGNISVVFEEVSA